MNEPKRAARIAGAGTYWAITSGNVILPSTIRGTRREAIDDLRRAYRPTGEPPSWEELRRRGYGVVKVRVEPAAGREGE